MTRCSQCNQELPQASGGASAPAAQREFVPISAPNKFAGICRTLATMPGATDRNIVALTDLPQSVARYKQLTVGQWKMFCAIHKQITDTWPPDKAAFLVEEEAQSFTVPPDDDSVPF